MAKIDDEVLMNILYNDIAGKAYHSYTTTTVSKDRFVPTNRIRRELLKQGLKLYYPTIRRAYDRLCTKGLCDRMKRGLYINYAPKELHCHIAIGNSFVTSKK